MIENPWSWSRPEIKIASKSSKKWLHDLDNADTFLRSSALLSRSRSDTLFKVLSSKDQKGDFSRSIISSFSWALFNFININLSFKTSLCQDHGVTFYFRSPIFYLFIFDRFLLNQDHDNPFTKSSRSIKENPITKIKIKVHSHPL